jgi:hypothetical protein
VPEIVLPDLNASPDQAQSPDPASGGELYSFAQFEADLMKVQPRPIDVYFLGPFMIYFALRAKKGMGRWTRRILFTAGIYTIYRNWQAYKALPQTVAQYTGGMIQVPAQANPAAIEPG